MQQPLPGKPETERTNNTTITIMRTQTRRIRAMAAGMLAVVAMLLSPIASAAQIKVKGCVTDATGEPLIGVTVLVKGTAKGTSTDIDGNYALSGKTGAACPPRPRPLDHGRRNKTDPQ